MNSFDLVRNFFQVLFFIACFFQIVLGGSLSPILFALAIICIYLNVVHFAFKLTFAKVNQEDHKDL